MNWTPAMQAAYAAETEAARLREAARRKMTISQRIDALLAAEGLVYPDADAIKREIRRLGAQLPRTDPGVVYYAAMYCPSAGSHLSPAQRAAFAASWGRVRDAAFAALRMPKPELMEEIRSAANLGYSLVEWREHAAKCAYWSEQPS